MRYYAADRLAEAGGTDKARARHAAAFLSLAERERQPEVLAREQDNFRAALDWSLGRGDPAGPRLARALGDFWLGRGLLARVGRVIAFGRAEAERYRRCGVRAERLTEAPLATDPDWA